MPRMHLQGSNRKGTTEGARGKSVLLPDWVWCCMATCFSDFERVRVTCAYHCSGVLQEPFFQPLVTF